MEEHYIKDVGKITYVYGVNLEEHKTVIEKQQKRIAELEQELAELKEKDNYHLRYELAGADETIANLKQQLAEAEEYIENDEVTKREYYQKTDEIIAKKDKEIKRLKNLFKLNNEVVINQGKEIFDLRVQVLQQKQNQKQLAIQELEKVKNFVDGRTYCADYINKRIQELKGE